MSLPINRVKYGSSWYVKFRPVPQHDVHVGCPEYVVPYRTPLALKMLRFFSL